MKFDVNAQVENRLNLKPNPKTFDLALCEIVEVKITENVAELIDDKGKESTYDYKGLSVPRLSITFRNVEDELERFYTESFNPIVSIKNDGSPQEKKDLDGIYLGMFAKLKHIHNGFEKQVNYKLITKLPDIDEKAIPSIRCEQFKAFFEAFVEAFNIGKDGVSPIYTNVLGYLKLVASQKGDRYETPKFVGQGFWEVAEIVNNIPQKPKKIEIKPNDRIELTAQATKGNSTRINTGQDDSIDAATQAVLDQINGVK